MKGMFKDMKSIYASKLYRSSNRKDRIVAALVNSANVGLVQQLADSLDEEYQVKELVDPDTELESAEGGAQGDIPEGLSSGMDNSSFNPSTDLVSYPSGGGASGDGIVFLDDEGGEVSEGTDEPLTEDEGEIEPEINENEEVTESTKIKASTCLDAGVLTVLKDGLNSIQDVSGVTRIVVKENELWIYYNDDTNLNNIMTEVIEYVVERYPGVDFNRLARSDNAIVFESVESTSVLNESA